MQIKSTNQLIIDIIKKELGFEKDKRYSRRYDDLDDLFGNWSKSELQAISNKINQERRIDPDFGSEKSNASLNVSLLLGSPIFEHSYNLPFNQFNAKAFLVDIKSDIMHSDHTSHSCGYLDKIQFGKLYG